jgi:hypothetical protein
LARSPSARCLARRSGGQLTPTAIRPYGYGYGYGYPGYSYGYGYPAYGYGGYYRPYYRPYYAGYYRPYYGYRVVRRVAYRRW